MFNVAFRFLLINAVVLTVGPQTVWAGSQEDPASADTRPSPHEGTLFQSDDPVVMRTEVLPIESYPVEELLEIVKLSFGGSVRVAIDSVHQQLVVTGPEEGIKEVWRLVHQIDRPSHSLNFEFYYLKGTIGGEPTHDLPSALEPIAKTLDKNGFGELSLMAPVIVRVDNDQGFSQSPTITSNLGVDGTETLEFHIEGTGLLTSSGAVQLELGSHLLSTWEADGAKRSRSRVHKLETTLTLPLEKYVVLAACPYSTAQSDAVALVVRVTIED